MNSPKFRIAILPGVRITRLNSDYDPHVMMSAGSVGELREKLDAEKEKSMTQNTNPDGPDRDAINRINTANNFFKLNLTPPRSVLRSSILDPLACWPSLVFDS